MSETHWKWSNVPKTAWGPRGWHWLHVTAINYSQEPTLHDARETFNRIWRFVTQLPCVECRTHAVAYVREHPPNLKDTHALQSWVWRFHNAVNLRLKKPVFPFEAYQQLYSDEIEWASWR
jgi:hypothetical protein